MEHEALETGCTVSDVSDLVVVELDPPVETDRQDSVCSAGDCLLDVAQGRFSFTAFGLTSLC